MTDSRKNPWAWDRLEKQQAVIAEFGREVVEGKVRDLCHRCAHWWETKCEHHLLPLTLAGDDCPYYQHVPMKEVTE